jgi:hypothetical protein
MISLGGQVNCEIFKIASVNKIQNYRKGPHLLSNVRNSDDATQEILSDGSWRMRDVQGRLFDLPCLRADVVVQFSIQAWQEKTCEYDFPTKNSSAIIIVWKEVTLVTLVRLIVP